MKHAILFMMIAAFATSSNASFAATATKTTTATQTSKKTEPKTLKEKVRSYARVDTNILALANKIDGLRSQMAAENKRHYDEITVIREQLKVATEKLQAHREKTGADRKKKKDAATAKKAVAQPAKK